MDLHAPYHVPAHVHDQHAHHHEHHGAVDYLHSNRTHFDKVANTYDDIPFAQELCSKIGAAMREEYAFDEEKVEVLDFACGTGLVSRELAPHAKQIVGVDISQGMVDQYNLRVANQGIPPDKMRAVRAELTGADGELDGQKFDVVICSMAYHHFTSTAEMTRMLAGFLRPGGVLLVADLVKSAQQDLLSDIAAHQSSPDAAHIVAHKGGFDEPDVRAVFDASGLEQFTFRPCVHIAKGERELNVFIAKGVKPFSAAE